MVLATLLVVIVGTGAGAVLGMSAILCNDVFRIYIRSDASDRAMLAFTRASIAAILAVGILFSLGNMGSMILGWSVISLQFRATTLFAPLCGVLFMPGRIKPGLP
jgi:Na+/proline symporter